MNIGGMILKGDSDDDYFPFALNSIKHICDTIVVYGESYNRGENIISVPQKELDTDFSAFRNSAMRYLSDCDWVLVIDADEVFAHPNGKAVTRAELEEHIHILEKMELTAVDIYTKHFMYNYFTIDGRNNGAHFTATRLFKPEKFFGYEGKIHEHLIPREGPSQLIGKSDNFCIFHFGHCKGPEKLREKYRRSMSFGKDNPFYPEFEGKDLKGFCSSHPIFRGTIPLIHYMGPMPECMRLW